MIEEAYEAVDTIQRDDWQQMREELGDVLFSAVNVSRFLDVDAEETLTGADRKSVV